MPEQITLVQAADMEEIWFDRAQKMDPFVTNRLTPHVKRDRAIMFATRLRMRCTFIMQSLLKGHRKDEKIKLSDIFKYEKNNPIPQRSDNRPRYPKG